METAGGTPSDPTVRVSTPDREPEADPQWYKDAVVYQLHIKTFFDANDDGNILDDLGQALRASQKA